MAKKVLIFMVILFAFLGASVYVFRSNIKKYAIDVILKSFPLPNVALANVRYDDAEGTLALEEIKVKNPKGFKSKYIMEADLVDMEISVITKPQLRLNINNIDIVKPVFFVERSAEGEWNFRELKKASAAKAQDQKNEGFSLMREAVAAEEQKKSRIIFPRTIKIDRGLVSLVDYFVEPGTRHELDLYPLSGVVTLDYDADNGTYEKIDFVGSCSIAGDPESLIKGGIEVFPLHEAATYDWEFNAYNIPLLALKPYLDRHSPFIVSGGSFNMASTVRTVDGRINGDYTMELMDLDFSVNPRKSNFPFLETSVKKLTLYMTNQRGNVIIDFKQKGVVGGQTQWALGPIAKRAVGMMAIDTVIDVIKAIEGGADSGAANEIISEEGIPPEVIDIFKDLF